MGIHCQILFSLCFKISQENVGAALIQKRNILFSFSCVKAGLYSYA